VSDSSLKRWFAPGMFLCVFIAGCARFPVPVESIHEDDQLIVQIERLVKGERYTHPIILNADDVAAVLEGLSVLEQPASWPLRLFNKTTRPERLFRRDDLRVLAASLAEGLRRANPDERIAFAIYEHGNNPVAERVVTSGWIAIRDPFFHVGIEYFRDLHPQPSTRSYYPFYQDLPPSPSSYTLLFEPKQFLVADPADGIPAIHFRDYLRTVLPASKHD
jgi:hypothetical protein